MGKTVRARSGSLSSSPTSSKPAIVEVASDGEYEDAMGDAMEYGAEERDDNM